MVTEESLRIEKERDALRTMFLSEGWKVLKDKLVQEQRFLNNIEAIHTQDDLCFRKGKVAKITEILGIEGNLETPQEDNSFNFLEY